MWIIILLYLKETPHLPTPKRKKEKGRGSINITTTGPIEINNILQKKVLFANKGSRTNWDLDWAELGLTHFHFFSSLSFHLNLYFRHYPMHNLLFNISLKKNKVQRCLLRWNLFLDNVVWPASLARHVISRDLICKHLPYGWWELLTPESLGKRPHSRDLLQ